MELGEFLLNASQVNFYCCSDSRDQTFGFCLVLAEKVFGKFNESETFWSGSVLQPKIGYLNTFEELDRDVGTIPYP